MHLVFFYYERFLFLQNLPTQPPTRAATQIKGRAPETSQKRPVLGSLGELRLRRKPAPRVHSSNHI